MEQNYNAIDKAFDKLELELKEKLQNESCHEMLPAIYGTGNFIIRAESERD
jgi:hypothetical protein